MYTDPLGGAMGLSAVDHHWAASLITAAAQELCGGRVVSVLEGGYDVLPESLALPRAVEAHVRGLAGVPY
jgi:acetoin utilization deacetylase AcuC-like enzyme